MAAIANLTRQLGASPMSVLMQDAGRLIEQHFIESALKRSAGDPAAAAALLGISREAIESTDKAVGES